MENKNYNEKWYHEKLLSTIKANNNNKNFQSWLHLRHLGYIFQTFNCLNWQQNVDMISKAVQHQTPQHWSYKSMIQTFHFSYLNIKKEEHNG